jgi:hypothetical protein
MLGGTYVAHNREVALDFSQDIANGLLDRIIETLEKYAVEAHEGFAILEEAAKAITKKTPPR